MILQSSPSHPRNSGRSFGTGLSPVVARRRISCRLVELCFCLPAVTRVPAPIAHASSVYHPTANTGADGDTDCTTLTVSLYPWPERPGQLAAGTRTTDIDLRSCRENAWRDHGG